MDARQHLMIARHNFDDPLEVEAIDNFLKESEEISVDLVAIEHEALWLFSGAGQIALTVDKVPKLTEEARESGRAQEFFLRHMTEVMSQVTSIRKALSSETT